jgi:hypothetical protein
MKGRVPQLHRMASPRSGRSEVRRCMRAQGVGPFLAARPDRPIWLQRECAKRGVARWWRGDADPGVDGDAAVGPGDQGVQVELDDLG